MGLPFQLMDGFLGLINVGNRYHHVLLAPSHGVPGPLRRQAARLPSPFLLPTVRKTGASPPTSLSQKHLSKKQFRLVRGRDKRQAASNTSVCLLVCCKVKQLLRNDRALLE